MLKLLNLKAHFKKRKGVVEKVAYFEMRLSTISRIFLFIEKFDEYKITS